MGDPDQAEGSCVRWTCPWNIDDMPGAWVRARAVLRDARHLPPSEQVRQAAPLTNAFAVYWAGFPHPDEVEFAQTMSGVVLTGGMLYVMVQPRNGAR